MELEGKNREKQSELLSISEQLASDLESYISGFANAGYAVRLLARKTDLNEKTIKRLIISSFSRRTAS